MLHILMTCSAPMQLQDQSSWVSLSKRAMSKHLQDACTCQALISLAGAPEGSKAG